MYGVVGLIQSDEWFMMRKDERLHTFPDARRCFMNVWPFMVDGEPQLTALMLQNGSWPLLITFYLIANAQCA